MFNKVKCIRRISAFLAIAAVSLSLNAANIPSNITPQQLEQFKRLSPSQQQALAKQMGVDISAIRQATQTQSSIQQQQNGELNQLYPRGTLFDESGNPVLPEDQLLEEQEADNEIKPFGYDIFANQPNTFAPSMDTAIPDNYPLGAGDELSIKVYGKVNQNYRGEINRQGNLEIPEIGHFHVAGMTYLEAKKYVIQEVKSKVYGVEVFVSMSNLRTIRVFVLGDAFKPGQYVLNSLSSVTHALIAAGGVSEIGSLRTIQVKRAGKLIGNVDLYDLLVKGDSTSDTVLQSGDVVFIPAVGEQVEISGEIRRPAIYEIKQGETVGDIINTAGGVLPSAYRNASSIERFNTEQLRTVQNLNLNKQQQLDMKVRAGDKIKIRKASDYISDSITLIGAVARPGQYQWMEGMKISDIVPSVHSHLLPDSDLVYGIVVREKDKARNIKVIQFSFFDILTNPETHDDITLNPRDKVIFFSMNKLKGDFSSDMGEFALTQEELESKQKEIAKTKHQSKLFWNKYGNKAKVNELAEDEYNLQLAEQTLEDITGDVAEQEVEYNDLHPFSRDRMLIPIIDKLKLQASAGLPLELVEIVGAVKYPGIYPLADEMDIGQLVNASGGLLESAYLNKAELTRTELTEDSAAKRAINLNLSKALVKQKDANKKLKSKDRLNVLTIPSWQENHIVELRGEFKFPGKYTIKRGETLGELIERVGGLTEFAYADGSVFTRSKLKQLEQRNLIKVAESLRMEIASKSLAQNKNSGMVDYSQAKMLLADLTKVKPVGRLVIDLAGVFSKENADVLLENGDVLYVPTLNNSINVIGQVQVATSHLYSEGLDAFDYIGLSGGVKQQADSDRIYIIRANGAVTVPNQGSWFTDSANVALQPGDTVVVPLDSDYMDNLTLWATGTQIIYQAAVAIAAIAGI